jgi:hypothetical protein
LLAAKREGGAMSPLTWYDLLIEDLSREEVAAHPLADL